ncbi:YlmC/YmxH family sporulation protein [Heyndrickxia acidiproducens]|jgi:YlmC/YmxH family sporulation protein|uniref:YlmC/YmxH family sporulation protein n=1 Tax=Heyndrickxia acidiproducens TaxID=1121084 RepID=UPI00035E8764|nr:YlmC/YmxH family sporulation protein [Heyndrickxia acidiproducens]
MVRISDFQIKDVVSISDGRKLGNVEDIDINLDTGTIESIIVGGVSGKMFGLFGKDEEVVIPWSNIVKIGADVILVRFKDTSYLQQQLQEPKK